MSRTTPEGIFLLEDYNWKPSFSNFLPGIAGETGIPLWAYYVSRGQCLCSAGVGDKNNQILEFLSFNRALQTVAQQGFRTFIRGGNKGIYEPFRKSRDRNIRQTMAVDSAELTLTERSPRRGLETEVVYFTLPGEDYPALVRVLTLRNISDRGLEGEVVDGVARILPFGCDQEILQTTARHIEGMIGVFDAGGVPLFRLKQSPADVERIEEIRKGNFYAAFTSTRPDPGRTSYIVDPAAIFSDSEIYDRPWRMARLRPGEVSRLPQARQNKTPCAFAVSPFRLKPEETFRIYSVIGQAGEEEIPVLLARIDPEYLAARRKENSRIIRAIRDKSFTASGSPDFDNYCRQTFLDNVIRGGMPVVFPTAEGKSAFYVYSRQNGDLERDYHFFVLDPTYYSQGTGHYRSVNQNRRCDVRFFPETEDENIRLFLNLIQTDGYNPLEVNQVTYRVRNRAGCRRWLKSIAGKEKSRRLGDLLDGSFSPGQFAMAAGKLKIRGADNPGRLLEKLLGYCVEEDSAGVHEGYWVDHWLYNLDLLDVFLSVFPDRAEDLLLNNRRYYFYDNPDLVVPRAEKFVLTPDGVRRYGAVARDRKKAELLASREQFPARMRTEGGKGEVYYTCLLTKLLCLVANRLATLDPAGIGIEMEADKPGWNDSMNGLPGIVGSSLCQTFELERALEFLLSCLAGLERPVRVYSELADFIAGLTRLVARRAAGKIGPRRYWDLSNTLKEKYRAATVYGIGGGEKTLSRDELACFLESGLKVVQLIYLPENRRRVFNPAGIPYTYLVNRVTRFRRRRGSDGQILLNPDGLPLVEPLSFRQEPLPLFLEGPVHYLRVHPEGAGSIYRAVRDSGLFDGKLKMYKVCESLEAAPFEIGRVKAWGPGWIENESIYTHMEFKYLLELLRSGLHGEFFADLLTMLPPFLSPEVYGRSPLENVSFIVSSAFPDETMHGRGLQPRLSGVTGEMIHILTLMTAGAEPFLLVGDGKLAFRLDPALPDWLFTQEAAERDIPADGGQKEKLRLPARSFAFLFLGRTLVVYHHPGGGDASSSSGTKVIRYRLTYRDGRKKTVVGPVVAGKAARDIREGKIARIDADLADLSSR
ncbi:MAG: hypothetical protein P9M08_09270 [Candidatus Erginobacter occultus]|nr:hypothetical protein [Candidatus Erginobacter occultus]